MCFPHSPPFLVPCVIPVFDAALLFETFLLLDLPIVIVWSVANPSWSTRWHFGQNANLQLLLVLNALVQHGIAKIDLPHIILIPLGFAHVPNPQSLVSDLFTLFGPVLLEFSCNNSPNSHNMVRLWYQIQL